MYNVRDLNHKITRFCAILYRKKYHKMHLRVLFISAESKHIDNKLYGFVLYGCVINFGKVFFYKLLQREKHFVLKSIGSLKQKIAIQVVLVIST